MERKKIKKSLPKKEILYSKIACYIMTNEKLKNSYIIL
jgi:hypothetical protein